MKTIVLSCLLLVGCGAELDPASRVNSTRILATRADQPYAAPGATVHLEALGSTPSGPLTWGFATCADPASFTVLSCLETVDPASVTIGAEPRVDVTVPADAIDRLPAAGQSLAGLGVLVAACPGALTLEAGGFACRDAAGRALADHDWVVGMKRVFARTTDRNQNPVVAGVTWDGQPWAETEIVDADPCATDGNVIDDCPKGLRHHVAAQIPPDSVESGTDSFGHAFREEVVVQLYATEGIFEHDTRIVDRPDSDWVARSAAAGTVVTMWIVVRDDRGGVTWVTRQVRVRG